MFLALNAKRIQTNDLASKVLNKNIRKRQDKLRISCISSSLYGDFPQAIYLNARFLALQKQNKKLSRFPLSTVSC